MIKKEVLIYTVNEALPGYLNIPEGDGSFPAIVFSNGYGAYHEMYDKMAEVFCEKGFVTLEYESRGSIGPRHGHQLCGSEWLEDCAAAVSFVYGLPEVDTERIGLAGVSMGGATTLTMGARDPRIKCLYAMAPYINGELNIKKPFIAASGEEAFHDYIKKMADNAAKMAIGFPSEYLPEHMNCFTGQIGTPDEAEAEARALHPLKVTNLPYDSIWNVYLHVDSLAAAAKITIPTMIIHGTGDRTLAYENSLILYEALACKEKEIHLIEGADHVLPEVAEEESIAYGLSWFMKYLM